MTPTDYYFVLGVSETASPQDIKAAYRKLAFEYHPDRTQGDPESTDKMKAVNEAYAVLSDQKKRREYDTLRQRFGDSATGEFRKSYSQQDIFSGSDINKIFEEVARSFGLRGVDDIFREFYGDGYKSFRVVRPWGSFSGILFSGTIGSFPFGRLLGKIPGKLLERITGVRLPKNGADTLDTIGLTADEALRGGPYAYFHRKRSKKLIVKIPPGVTHGRRIRLAGMGESGAGGGPPGDLYLRVRIQRTLGEKVKSLVTAAFRGK
jgi:DnaJ-class molecular chaperone